MAAKDKNYNNPKPEAYIEYDKFIEFDSEEVPAILNWGIGNRYRVELLIEEVQESKDSEQEIVRARFKIVSVDAKYGEMPQHIKKLVGNTN